MIEVTLPNGQVVAVRTEDEAIARRTANDYFRQEFPDDFERYRRTLPQGGFFENFARSARGAAGSQVSGVAAGAQSLGAEGVAAGARSLGEAIQGEDPIDRRGFTGASDLFQAFREAPLETARAAAGQALGGLAGSVAAPAVIGGAAALAGAGAPVVAPLVMGTAILTGALSSGAELEQALRAEGVEPQRAAQLAASAGYLIGAGEGGAAGLLLNKALGRQIRRETAEVLARAASRTTAQGAGRGLGSGALLEGGSELAGSAAREGVVAVETGNTNLAERADRAALDALFGAVGGGALGAAGGARDPSRARAELDRRDPLPTPNEPAAPPPDTTADNLPEPPTPFDPSDPEAPRAAREFLHYNRLAGGLDLSDDNLVVDYANRAQQQIFRQETEVLRTNELSRFLEIGAQRERPDGTTDFGVQGDRVYQKLLSMSASPDVPFDGSNFTARDLGNQVLQAFSSRAEPVNRTEATLIEQQLRALKDAGYLEQGEGGKRTYSLALRERPAVQAPDVPVMPTRADRQTPPTEQQLADYPGLVDLATKAEPSADQQQAGAILNDLSSGNLGSDVITQAARNANETYKKFLFDYLGLEKRKVQLEAQRAALPTEADFRPDVAQQLQTVDNELAQIGQIQATIRDYFQGIAEGSFRSTAVPMQNYVGGTPRLEVPAPSTPTTDVGRSNPQDDPGVAAIEQGWRNASDADKAAAQQAVADRELDTYLNEPANRVPVQAFVWDLIKDLKPRSQLSNMRIREQARSKMDMELSQADATRIYDQARKFGFINSIGVIQDPNAPTTTAKNIPIPDFPRDASKLEPATRNKPPAPAAAPATPTNAQRLDAIKAKYAKDKRPEAQKFLAGLNKVNPDNITEEWLQKAESLAKIKSPTKAKQPTPQTNPEPDVDPATKASAAFMEEDAPDDGVVFLDPGQPSLNPNLPQGHASMSHQDVVAVIEEATADWINAPTIKVVSSPNQLPQAFRDNNSPDTVNSVRGLYYNGEVYVVASNQWSPASVRSTLFHESLGHYGLAQAFGNQVRSLMSRAYQTNKEIRRQADKYLELYPDAFLEVDEDTRRSYAAEEVFAEAIEVNDIPDPTLLDRLKQLIVDFGRRIGFFKETMTNMEAANILREAVNAVRNGPMPAIQARNTNILAPAMPAQLQRTKKALRSSQDLVKGPLKWFYSPVLTMGKVRAELRGLADVMRQMYTRSSQAVTTLERMAGPYGRLSPESLGKVAKVWEASSRNRKKPDISKLNAQERTALDSLMKTTQRALDFLIESYVMDYFRPENAKTPADRARLEAFWKANANKHLWEIPPGQLAAASSEGYSKMRAFERLRNPYYMPMVAQGTHFVAAYSDPKRTKLLALVAYTPNGAMRRVRGLADPEAEAIKQLKAEFPSAYVMDKGQQFTKDERRRQLGEVGDFITEYMSELRDAGTKEQQQIIDRMKQDIDKAQMERFFRANQNILRPLTSLNTNSYLLDVMPQYILSLSKVQARRFTETPFQKATETLSPNDYNFFKELRDYTSTPTEAWGGARALAFFWYLGFAIDTAVINVTQLPQLVYPMLVRDGGTAGATKYLGSAMKDVFLNRHVAKALGGELNLSASLAKSLGADEGAAIERAMKDGVFSPVFASESRGQFTAEGFRKAGFKNAERAAHFSNKMTHWASSLMQAIEEGNRLSAFLAAYRMAKANPSVVSRASKLDGNNYSDAYTYAATKSMDTNFLTTKEDRAYIQRFTPAAEVATQFMSYPLKTVEIFMQNARNTIKGMRDQDMLLAKSGAIALLGQTAMLVGLAGIWGLPFAETGRELLEEIVGFLWGSTQNFDMDLREMLGGGQFAEAFVRGVPHMMGGMSLSQRLQINPLPIDELFEASPLALLGPVGGLTEIPIRAYEAYNNSDPVAFAAAFMPRAAANVIKGAGLAMTEEQLTRRGNRIVTPADVQAYNETTSVPASVRQALGFPPPEFVNMREVVTRAEEIDKQVRTQTERFNKELAGHLRRALDAQREGDAPRMARELDSYRNRFVEIAKEQEDRPLDRRIVLNHSSIQRRAIRDFYGISSEETLSQKGRQLARPEILRQRAILMGED